MADAAWRPSATLDVVRRRAALVERTRAFFRTRDVLEVDTPVLQGGANLDHGVVPLRIDTPDGARFLPTSPEHPLKRLVAAERVDAWTLAPAFRRGESGRRHAPEFRMLEWYRTGWDDRRLADEAIALLADLTGLGDASERVTWRDAYRQHAGFDPIEAPLSAIEVLLGDAAAAIRGDRRAALDLALATLVEPHLGRGRWTILDEYPPEAAAQARLRVGADGRPVAARFELYRDGVELANGYWELTDAAELDRRLDDELAARGDRALQRDQRFAAAMAHGLGDCAGIAVGFDRVVMLALGIDDIALVQAFAWDRA
ncbi:MAG: EF-P lysine aminoacylase GenX [Planctomycetes bacterium]|nr:EF-P lysine aminoacylase GenX [Planctomycetota bacterium]